MPPSLRDRGAQAHDDDTDSEPDLTFPMNGHLQHLPQQDLDDDEDGLIGDDPSSNEDEEEEEEPSQPSSLPTHDPPPPYLRDISTLASWSVSSSKPGCSVPQLRHPSTNLFWQSDGPQPHYLNIHFFKQVKIVGLRMYLDFEQDESYTPTRIVFLAGTGVNDLVEWGEWRGEGPRGWVWVGFGGVDDDEGEDYDDDDDNSDQAPLAIQNIERREATRHTGNESEPSENTPQQPQEHHQHQHHPATPQMSHNHNHNHNHNPILRPSPRRPFSSLLNPAPQTTPHMPVLRAHLVQIKILENHQNGKDTHLRGLQIFARNDDGGAARGGLGRDRTGDEVGIMSREGVGGRRRRRVERYDGEVELEGGQFGGWEGGRIR